MNNSEYWKKRFEILEKSAVSKGAGYYSSLEKEYREASRRIESEISAWYTRFAANNQITLTEAKRLLNSSELAEFRWNVQDYIKFGEENALNGQWMKQLENASARVHISRLEALKIQLQQHMEALYDNQTDGIDTLARKIYSDGYYHTAFEVQKGFNVGWDLQSLNEKQLSKVLNKPWTADNQTFRDKCWKQKTDLVSIVSTELTQAIMRGDSPDKAIKTISEKFDVAKNKAGRLVMTESAFFASEAQKDCFTELNVERYKIVASLDARTSQICQDLDGQVFDMKDFQPGVTAPPFHPWCRSTTVPYFEDNYGERAARDAEGKTYYVPSDMKYAEWKGKYVVQPGKTRYNIFRNAVLEELKGYSASMHSGNQSKHIRGRHNFSPTRGELTVDPQMLYARYSCKGQFLKTNAGDWNHKERFTHTETIGIYRSKYTGKEVPTNTGIIHYSKRNGWHIVPARPQKGAAE